MNAIEQALARTAKRQEREARKTLTLPKIEPVLQKPPVEVPKAKSHDGVVDITVTMPTGSFSFKFVKINAVGNIPPSRQTKEEFRRMFINGFAPLLGTVSEFPADPLK